MLGGFCTKEKKHKRSCSRYNIVLEKWQQISPMIFHKENAAACAINEFQIIVAGGRSQGGNLTDTVEIYDLRENSWKVFSVGISEPR
jgi:N-acetylneuraminic acid mutarotase